MQNANGKRRWDVYPGFPNRIDRGGPRVTLNARGVFLLNQAAYAAMDSPRAVELRYDGDTRTIGLTPKDPRHQNAFPVKGKPESKKWNYRLIHAAPFCKHYELTPRRTILFVDIDMDNDGTLTLELSTAVAVGRGFR